MGEGSIMGTIKSNKLYSLFNNNHLLKDDKVFLGTSYLSFFQNEITKFADNIKHLTFSVNIKTSHTFDN